MILTVTLNAAVDTTYRIDGFQIDRVHRPSERKTVAGGKGINVARVFRTLGGEVISTGFLGGSTGRFVGNCLREEGLDGRFVSTREASRNCIAIVDPRTGKQTEVNETGPCIYENELARFIRAFKRLLKFNRFSYVALSGSVPPGVPDNIYADLIEIARRNGVRSALDASGEPLRQGASAEPWMIKPNIHELSMLSGAHPEEVSDIIEAAHEHLGGGTEVVCVTRGQLSAICLGLPGQWSGHPPKVRFASAVGSGDAFLAAFLRRIESGGSLPAALSWAIGAGSANAEEYGAGSCSAEAIGRMAERVRVEEL